jgi:flagellar basal-body rod modification protein FlgD
MAASTGGVGSTLPTGNAPVAKKDLMEDPFQQKEMFLKLLVAQLKNQDPTSPMDQKEMLGQMAQFTTVEQLSNLAKTMESMQLNATFAQSVSLIGKTVSYLGEDGESVINGVSVTGVSNTGGKVSLVLDDGSKVEPARVVTVS